MDRRRAGARPRLRGGRLLRPAQPRPGRPTLSATLPRRVMTYRPSSACGRGCLPRPGSVARAAWPVVGLRFVAVLGLAAAALGLAAGLALLTVSGRRRAVRGWFRLLLRACGVRLTVGGAVEIAPPGLAVPGVATGTLVAANHVSWLDIPALMAVDTVRLLAKSEVGRWPLLGPLAARAGTVFIDRSRLRQLPVTVAEIAAALRAGQT